MHNDTTQTAPVARIFEIRTRLTTSHIRLTSKSSIHQNHVSSTPQSLRSSKRTNQAGIKIFQLRFSPELVSVWNKHSTKVIITSSFYFNNYFNMAFRLAIYENQHISVLLSRSRLLFLFHLLSWFHMTIHPPDHHVTVCRPTSQVTWPPVAL